MTEPATSPRRCRGSPRERPTQSRCAAPARAAPDGLARYDVTLTYRELDARSDAIAAGLARRGIVRGTRTVVMVRPSPEFFLLMFALFKAGAVPVLVDPGIDRRALRQCLDEAQPQAFIGIPLAHVARVLLGWARRARIRITTGTRAWLGRCDAGAGRARRGAGAGRAAGRHAARRRRRDPVHQRLDRRAQGRGVPAPAFRRAGRRCCGEAFGIAPGGVDLPTFPPFALFDPALGADLGDPGHGSDPAGAGRSAQAARCDRALRRRPAVRLAGVDGGAGATTARRCPA